MAIAPVWTGTEITVTLHWAKWLPCMGLLAALTFMAGIGVVAGVGLYLDIGALCLLAALLAAAAWPAIEALRAGFLVRLDSAGVHGRGQVIRWRELQALDVGTTHLTVRCSNGSRLTIPLLFAKFDPDLLPQAVRASSQFWKACHG